MDVHHIVPQADGGPDTIDNAIALCHSCHEQAGHYNPKHAIGNKYSPDELVAARDRLWALVERDPGVALPNGPVAVTPGRIDFPRRAAETRLVQLHVTNQSPHALYGISIAIVLSGAQYGPALAIGPGYLEPALLGEESYEVVRVHLDCFAVQGEMHGLPVWWLAIWGLRPQTLHQLRMTASVGKDVPDGEEVFGVTHLTRIGHEPPTVTRRADPDAPGWEQILVQVWVGEDQSYVIGASVGPPIDSQADPG